MNLPTAIAVLCVAVLLYFPARYLLTHRGQGCTGCTGCGDCTACRACSRSKK